MKNYPILFFTLLLLFSLSISKRKEKMKKFPKAKLPNFLNLHSFLTQNETRANDPEEEFSEEDALDGAVYSPEVDIKEESEDSEDEEAEPKIDEKEKSKVNVKCIWANSYNVYSLEKLQKKKDGDYEKSVIILLFSYFYFNIFFKYIYFV